RFLLRRSLFACFFFSVCSFSLHRSLPSFPTRRSSDLEGGLDFGRDDGAGEGVFFGFGGLGRAGQLAAERFGLAHVERLCLNLARSEEHTSELQSRFDLVCRLLLEKKK